MPNEMPRALGDDEVASKSAKFEGRCALNIEFRLLGHESLTCFTESVLVEGTNRSRVKAGSWQKRNYVVSEAKMLPLTPSTQPESVGRNSDYRVYEIRLCCSHSTHLSQLCSTTVY